MNATQKLPLHDFHDSRMARFVSFAGWSLPVAYGSSVQEHMGVRNSVRMFDVSHMGEIIVKGRESMKFLNRCLTNNLLKCKLGGAQYGLLCQEDGGVIDDLVVYRTGAEEFLLCVNAANTEKDYDVLSDASSEFDCLVENQSAAFGQLAIQGPLAVQALSESIETKLSKLNRFEFLEGGWMGKKAILSRTGYTGEDGLELYCPVEDLLKWVEALEALGIEWAGLAARDSLRLESGMPLYGNELSLAISPLQAGLSWAVAWEKDDFMGATALRNERAAGPKRRLAYYLGEERRIPRQGGAVLDSYGEQRGCVLSGGFSPLASRPMGTALLTYESWLRREESGWSAMVGSSKISISFGPPALKRLSPRN